MCGCGGLRHLSEGQVHNTHLGSLLKMAEMGEAGGKDCMVPASAFMSEGARAGVWLAFLCQHPRSK